MIAMIYPTSLATKATEEALAAPIVGASEALILELTMCVTRTLATSQTTPYR